MKKIIALLATAILTVCCTFGLVGCGTEKIAVQKGTTGEYFVKGDEDWGYEGLENYEVLGLSNGGLAVTAMKNGQAKYVIIDKAPAVSLVSKVSGIKMIDFNLTEEEYAFGVDKNQPQLLIDINNALQTITNNGTFASILDKYFNGGDITPISCATSADPSKADSQLVVATNAAFAPFEYKDGNNFAGIDVEVMSAIADILEMELVIVDMEFASVVTSVGNNYIDVAAAGLTVNEVRKQSVNFTNSYYNAAQVLITLADDTTFDACTSAKDVIAILNK